MLFAELEITCPYCGSDEYDLDRPLWKGHSENEVVVFAHCDKCGKRFTLHGTINYYKIDSLKQLAVTYGSRN